MSSSKRERNANFTDDELRCLLGEIFKNREALMSKQQSSQAIRSKREVWRNIAAKVSALGVTNRGDDQVRKKWLDLKTQVCTYLAKRRSGVPDHENVKPSHYEDFVLKILGYDRKQINAALSSSDRRVMKVMGLTGAALNKGSNSQDFDMDLGEGEDDNIFAVMEEDDDMGPSTSHDIGNLATPGIPDGEHHDSSAVDLSGEGTGAGNPLCLENGSFSKQNEPTKRKRIIRNSDVLLAIKRKKLRLLEDRIQIERERLAVEKEILETLKEIKSVQAPQSF